MNGLAAKLKLGKALLASAAGLKLKAGLASVLLSVGWGSKKLNIE